MLKIYISIIFLLLFSGCALSGPKYPKKTAKIYIESTTKKDTKNITPLNGQLYGFDNVVSENTMQCDVLPELTDVLTQRGWTTTKNKSEADYQISVSTVYCGYPLSNMHNSNKTIPIQDRVTFKEMYKLSQQFDSNITYEDLINENKKALKTMQMYFDVKNYNPDYYNVYSNKYLDAPGHVKKLVTSKIERQEYAHYRTKTNRGYDIKKTTNSNTLNRNVQSSASANNYNSNAGAAMLGISLLMSGDGPTKKPNENEVSGYAVIFKIYNPVTNKTEEKLFTQETELVMPIKKYEHYQSGMADFIDGLF